MVVYTVSGGHIGDLVEFADDGTGYPTGGWVDMAPRDWRRGMKLSARKVY